jgi:uncharacterized cupredoxin-like copper-binding protein
MNSRLITTYAITIIFALVILTTGCDQSDDGGDLDGPNTVEVTAQGLDLLAPDEVPAGWTTFRFDNVSGMLHFAVLERLPEGIGVEDQQEEVAPVFQEGMDLLNAGDFEAAMAAFGELPVWFNDIVFLSGPGFLAPGRTSQTTVYLEPGTYLLECYVKTNGVFHSYNPSPDEYGMVKEITVTEESLDASAPEADIEMTISSEGGIVVEGDAEPGEQTIAVFFEDQIVHEHFLGHDVHLARLEEDTDLEALATWMDWTQPTGLETPAPVEFLGGTHEMPAGETGYFTVDLEPGQRYAWIAEVPNSAEKGMLRTFTVPSE